MKGSSINTPVVNTNLAEGAVDAVEPSMPDTTLDVPNEPDFESMLDEREQVTEPLNPLILPPAAETGLMPVVVVAAEGTDDTDGQDATRTTAEIQVLSPVNV
ncbi:MAG: hypothetical protein CUN53_09215 [Phototrophicales bacterium]|nr:MAG: hypothetical protein CUN53_09215 [Phototrophicales bacterium]